MSNFQFLIFSQIEKAQNFKVQSVKHQNPNSKYETKSNIQTTNLTNTQKQFLVQDPDGYLLRFFEVQ